MGSPTQQIHVRDMYMHSLLVIQYQSVYTKVCHSNIYNIIIDLRRHSSDIYFQIYPIQNGVSYVANLLAHVGESSATMVKMNN